MTTSLTPDLEDVTGPILRCEELPLTDSARAGLGYAAKTPEEVYAALRTADRMYATSGGNYRVMSRETGASVVITPDHQVAAYTADDRAALQRDVRAWMQQLDGTYVPVPGFVSDYLQRDVRLSFQVHTSIRQGFFTRRFITDAVGAARQARRSLGGNYLLDTPSGVASLNDQLEVIGIDQTATVVDENMSIEDMKERLRETAWHTIQYEKRQYEEFTAARDSEMWREVGRTRPSRPRLSGQKSKRSSMPTTLQEVVRLLESRGYELKINNGHYQVTHPDKDGKVTFGSSPSDHRWIQNMASTFRRQFHDELRY